MTKEPETTSPAVEGPALEGDATESTSAAATAEITTTVAKASSTKSRRGRRTISPPKDGFTEARTRRGSKAIVESRASVAPVNDEPLDAPPVASDLPARSMAAAITDLQQTLATC
jgi:hypothetical protein